eukprot:3574372-Prymnesium_polylepis.1
MAPGGTMAHPNQPANVQDAIRRFGISSDFAPQRAPTQVQTASTVHTPFDEFKPSIHPPACWSAAATWLSIPALIIRFRQR